MVGAVGASERELVGPARRGDHRRPHRLADLDRGEADAAGRAEHEQPFAWAQMGAQVERRVRSAIGNRKRRGDVEIHAVGNREGERRGADDLLREGAVVEHDDHARAGRDAGIGGRLDDGARRLEAGHEGHRRLDLVLALDDQRVGEVECGGGDAHPHHPAFERRRGQIGDRQRFGRPVVAAEDGAHRLTTRSGGPRRPRARRDC